jgi:hypothetical protein
LSFLLFFFDFFFSLICSLSCETQKKEEVEDKSELYLVTQVLNKYIHKSKTFQWQAETKIECNSLFIEEAKRHIPKMKSRHYMQIEAKGEPLESEQEREIERTSK